MKVTIEVNTWIASGMREYLESKLYHVDSHMVNPGGDGLDYLHVSRGFHSLPSLLDKRLKEVGFHKSQYRIIEEN